MMAPKLGGYRRSRKRLRMIANREHWPTAEMVARWVAARRAWVVR